MSAHGAVMHAIRRSAVGADTSFTYVYICGVAATDTLERVHPEHGYSSVRSSNSRFCWCWQTARHYTLTRPTCRVVSLPTLHCPATPRPALPWLALPHPASPHPSQSCPTPSFPQTSQSHSTTPAPFWPPPPPCHAVGLKIGKFSVSAACDPDNLDRQQREADLLPLQAAVQEFMPHAAGPVTDFAACMFIMTPDGHFVIDTHPKHEQVSENRVGGVAVVGVLRQLLHSSVHGIWWLELHVKLTVQLLLQQLT